jgi:hypothetical protein
MSNTAKVEIPGAGDDGKGLTFDLILLLTPLLLILMLFI